MKHILLLTLITGSSLVGLSPAHAATRIAAPAVSTQSVELVAEGCGRGFVRDRYGRCRPAYAPRPRCGYGYHPTPYGCRRN